MQLMASYLLLISLFSWMQLSQSFFTAVQISSVQATTSDWPDLTASLSVIDQGTEYQVSEHIHNGQFLQGLTGWDVENGATVLTENDSDIAFERGSILKLGDEGERSSHKSSISQRVEISHPVYAVSFEYNVSSLETAYGFDTASFRVLIDDAVVFYSDPTYTIHNSEWSYSGWRRVSLLLKRSQDFTLKFEVMNTGDDLKPTVVYIDTITTHSLPITQTSQLKVAVDGPIPVYANYQYQTPTGVLTGSAEHSILFTINEPPLDKNLNFYATDRFGRQSEVISVPVHYDGVHPQEITNLTVYSETEGEVSLTWTAPEDDVLQLILGYRLQIATDRDFTKMFDSNQLQILNNRFSDIGMVPAYSGMQQDYLVRELPPGEYFFKVESYNSVGNVSQVSNIASATVAF